MGGQNPCNPRPGQRVAGHARKKSRFKQGITPAAARTAPKVRRHKGDRHKGDRHKGDGSFVLTK